MDSAMWMLDYFKAPPFRVSIEGMDHYNYDKHQQDWYLQNAAKLMGDAIVGWTEEKLLDF